MAIVNLSFENDIAHMNFDDGKANVLNAESLTALDEALAEAKAARAVVFSGREGTFCGGLDLKTLPRLPKEEFQTTLRQFGRFCQSLLTFLDRWLPPSPATPSRGEPFCCCAAIIASAKKGSSRSGCRRSLSVMPLPSFVIRLAEHGVSKRHIIEAVLHGRLYPPQDAERVGYLQSVVGPGHAVARAHGAAAKLAALPNPAYLLTKSRLTGAITSMLETFDEEMDFFVTAFDWSAARPAAGESRGRPWPAADS